MIERAVSEVAADRLKHHGVKVVISVPMGEEMAKKTDNPRLGIIGGISILGTTGIVFPYSTASFGSAIRQALDVARAMGNERVVLTTGGRSEDFAKDLFGKNLPRALLHSNGRLCRLLYQTLRAKTNPEGYNSRFCWKINKNVDGNQADPCSRLARRHGVHGARCFRVLPEDSDVDSRGNKKCQYR